MSSSVHNVPNQTIKTTTGNNSHSRKSMEDRTKEDSV